MPAPINKQVIVITGATSGIGLATARALGHVGATVVIAARNETRLREIKDEMGSQAEVLATDVTDLGQVSRLVAETQRRHGRIDTWVNNAGIDIRGRFADLAPDQIEQILQVNLLGTINGMKAVLPQLTAQGFGGIINVSSLAAIRGVPYRATYSAAKHGVKGLSEALRIELAREHPRITISLIHPGRVTTHFNAADQPKFGGLTKYVYRTYGPDDVAEAIVRVAAQPKRDVYIGHGRLLVIAEALAPALMDRVYARASRE